MGSHKVKLQLVTLLFARVALYTRGAIPRQNGIFAIQDSTDTQLAEKPAKDCVLHEIDCPESWLQLGLGRWDSAANLRPACDELACVGSNLSPPHAMNYDGEFNPTERHITHGFSPSGFSGSAWLSYFGEQVSTSRPCFPNFQKPKNTGVLLEDSRTLSKQWQGNPGTLCIFRREKALSKGCSQTLTSHLQQAETETPALENDSGAFLNQESCLAKSSEKISARKIKLALPWNDESDGKSEALMTDPRLGKESPRHVFPRRVNLKQVVEKKNKHHMHFADKKFTVIPKKINPKDWQFLRLDLKKNDDEKKIDGEKFSNVFQKIKREKLESLCLWKNDNLGTKAIFEFENGPYPEELLPKHIRLELLAEVALEIFDLNFKGSEYVRLLEGIRALVANSLQRKMRGYEKSFIIQQKIFMITEFVIDITKMVMLNINITLKLVKDVDSKYSYQKDMEGIMFFLEEFWREIYHIEANSALMKNRNLSNIVEIARLGDSFQRNHEKMYQFRAALRHLISGNAWIIVGYLWEKHSEKIIGYSKDVFISKKNLSAFSNRAILYSNYSLILKGIQQKKYSIGKKKAKRN